MFLKKMHLPLKVIAMVDTVMNLSIWTIIDFILKQYGFLYLVKYVFWLSLI